MYLLAASGAFRTILLLLIVWLVLRMWMRSQRPAGGAPPPRGTRWTAPDDRRPGDVRIERAEARTRGPGGPDVEDAEFEEIK